MTAGELFVTIGIKGAETATKAVNSVKSGLQEVGSTSLAAKAAIVGVIYSLEQMMSSSARTGAELKNFESITGISAVTLQKYQYLARKVNVSSEEMQASFRGVQKAMLGMLLGGQVPEGMRILFKDIGFDPKRARDTVYVMEKLQEAAHKLPVDVFAKFASSMGLTEGGINFLIRNKDNIASVKDSMVMSDAQINQLAKVDAAWSQLWNRFKLISGAQTAKFGLFAVDEINKAVTFLQRLLKAMTDIVGYGPTIAAVLGAIGLALYAAFGPLGPIIAGLGLLFGELEKVAEGKDNFFSKIGKWLEDKGITGPTPKTISDFGGGDPMAYLKARAAEAGVSSTTNNNVFNIHDAHDPKKTAEEISKHLARQNQQVKRQDRSALVTK